MRGCLRVGPLAARGVVAPVSLPLPLPLHGQAPASCWPLGVVACNVACCSLHLHVDAAGWRGRQPPQGRCACGSARYGTRRRRGHGSTLPCAERHSLATVVRTGYDGAREKQQGEAVVLFPVNFGDRLAGRPVLTPQQDPHSSRMP
jgi:hypothetical protein